VARIDICTNGFDEITTVHPMILSVKPPKPVTAGPEINGRGLPACDPNVRY